MTERTNRFEGKVVFITGVARGQGREHALRFASEGAQIIGVDICEDLSTSYYPLATEEDLAETIRLVEAAGGEILAKKCDVRDLPGLREVVGEGFEMFGRLDVVVANAGIYVPNPVQFITSEQWDETIGVNLTGVFNTVRACVNKMVKQDEGGSIAIISSTAGLRGFYGSPAYNASKHGLVGFMRSIALELAPKKIRVNTIHPTSVGTPMILNDTFPKLVRSDLDDPSFEDAGEFLKTQQPMDVAWLEPGDISDAVLWLCSDEARYITGVTLPVDAGAVIQ